MRNVIKLTNGFILRGSYRLGSKTSLALEITATCAAGISTTARRLIPMGTVPAEHLLDQALLAATVAASTLTSASAPGEIRQALIA